ncbi:MAG: tryptophan-rich sensory protein [Patescibacteria group bacterium]|nr:tryptophan-rich sensory protein [Patescibacteria group bacterium]
MPQINLKDWAIFLASIIVCQMAGVIGSFFTISAITGWYATLSKPFFSPPNWVFGPVWISLYTLMGVSLFFLWRSRPQSSDRRRALCLFGAQLILNAFWSVAFFGLRNALFGLLIILPLLGLIGWLILTLKKVNLIAAALLYPYFLWVSFASILNFSVWYLNR